MAYNELIKEVEKNVKVKYALCYDEMSYDDSRKLSSFSDLEKLTYRQKITYYCQNNSFLHTSEDDIEYLNEILTYTYLVAKLDFLHKDLLPEIVRLFNHFLVSDYGTILAILNDIKIKKRFRQLSMVPKEYRDEKVARVFTKIIKLLREQLNDEMDINSIRSKICIYFEKEGTWYGGKINENRRL